MNAVIEQGTEEWHQQRCGLPTASNASLIITSAGEPSKSMGDYADQLAAEVYAGKPLDSWKGNSSTERGHEMEPLARAAYSFETDADVELSGFVLSADERFDCSPDGLIGDTGMVEIKCCVMKGHISALLYGNKHGKAPVGYLAQVWFQLLVTGREWCDLYHWHPDLPSMRWRISAETIPPKLITQIDACIERRDSTLDILRTL